MEREHEHDLYLQCSDDHNQEGNEERHEGDDQQKEAWSEVTINKQEGQKVKLIGRYQ